jgi:hypothetical protein
MPNQTRLLELALKGLEIERGRIDDEIGDLRGQLRTDGAASTPIAPAAQPAGRRRSGGISAAGRRKISEMMKARWAARRKGVQVGHTSETG